VIIDFEGEPLTSSAERRKLDSVWRDVAGALRSFDYARSAHPDPNSAAARSWVAATRQAFLTGYLDSAAAPPAVLRAYQLDKAVYEVRYELRNRPEWAYIPLGSVQDELTGFSGEPPVLA
jgi:maltokinase